MRRGGGESRQIWRKGDDERKSFPPSARRSGEENCLPRRGGEMRTERKTRTGHIPEAKTLLESKTAFYSYTTFISDDMEYSHDVSEKNATYI